MEDTTGNSVPMLSFSPDYGSVSHAVDMAEELMIDPFGENYQQDTIFWANVSKCFRANNEKIKWVDIEMRFRLQRLEEIYKEQKKDILFELITNVYDNFDSHVNSYGNKEIKESFVKQLTEFVTILLREDYNGYQSFLLNPLSNSAVEEHDKTKENTKSRTDNDRNYAGLVSIEDYQGKTSVLHLAAQRNLTGVAKVYLSYYPGYVCREDEPAEDSDESARMAVEWALEKSHDDICSFLLKSTLNERVRHLFEGTEKHSADYSYNEIIKKGTMKKTVNAILDSCVNPNFPFIVQDPEQKLKEEEAWSKMASLPLRYNFFFQVLDGDNEGKPAKIYNDARQFKRNNADFNALNVSPLQLVADHADPKDEQDAIRHPTVRQLVRCKWDSYGKKVVIFQTFCYILFLLVLGLALGLGARLQKPTAYNDSTDKFRGFCEITSLIFAVIYIILEVEQFFRSPQSYLKDILWNVMDISGLLAIFIIIPCRYAEALMVTRYIAAFAFLINFIRVFQYFLVYEEYGVYVKTFAKIITTDIIKFAVLFTIVWIAFSGSAYLVLAAVKGFNKDFTSFWDIILQELRALTEGKEFADSYAEYNIVFTLFMMVNMLFIIVILSNVLIGQVSYRYEKAQEEASIQYDIDKAKMLCSIDRSLLFYKLRVKHYRKGLFVSDRELIQDLLTDWDKSQADEEVEKAITKMLKQRILKHK